MKKTSFLLYSIIMIYKKFKWYIKKCFVQSYCSFGQRKLIRILLTANIQLKCYRSIVLYINI